MRSVNKITSIIWCVGLYCSLQAEKINLEIYASRFDSIPIGIVDFKPRPSGRELTANQPWEVIANDFDYSGRFQVTKQKAFDSAAFAAKGIGIYIDGEYLAADDGQVSFSAMVKDAGTGEPIFTKEYQCGMAGLRKAAHRFSNENYELLFGEAGVFESRILYVRSNQGKKSIAVMDCDGYGAARLTDDKTLHLFPVFADSATMVFTSYQRGKPDIYRCVIGEKTHTVIAASRGIQVSPAVSSIDNSLVYASSKGGSPDIYTCDLDGGNTRHLTVGGGVETAPCWSPSGYQIAYTSDRPGNPHIFIMDADGANQRRITRKSRYCDAPAWSPRGEKIAYVSMNEKGKLDIWTIAPDGSDERQVTTMHGHNESPVWSPNGMLIGFINRTGGRSDFYVMRPDGSRIKQVTATGDVIMPDWGK